MVSLDWRQQVNSVAKWTACLRLLHSWNKQQSVIKVLYVAAGCCVRAAPYCQAHGKCSQHVCSPYSSDLLSISLTAHCTSLS